jgi:hypothetical protein
MATMILGQPVAQGGRVPFQRPRYGAAGYIPRMIKPAFQTHLHPLQHVLPAMRGMIPRLPTAGATAQMAPGAPRHRPGVVAQEGGGCTNCPPAVATPAPAAPTPAATAGFGFTALGRVAGGRGINPYRVLRTGGWPGIASNGANVRAGRDAGAFIRRMMPAGFPNVAVPAGSYAALPAAAPAPAPTAGYYW